MSINVRLLSLTWHVRIRCGPYAGSEDAIPARRVSRCIAVHDERVRLCTADTGDPGRGSNGASIVVGGYDDGRDVAITCAAISRAAGDARSCWAGEQEAPVADVSGASLESVDLV